MKEEPNAVDLPAHTYADTDSLDLVCNEFVAAERKKRSFLSDAGSVGNVLLAFFMALFVLPVLIPILVMLLILPILGCVLIITPTTDAAVRLGLFAANVVVIPILLWLWVNIFSNFRGFPTNLEMNARGIRFSWRAESDFSTQYVPWQSIIAVSVERNPEKESAEHDYKEIVVLLTIHKNAFRRVELIPFITQTKRLWRGFFPMDRGRNVIRLKFPLDALTLEADKFRLISAIKEKAPADALHSEFIALLDSNKAPTYTQLWLDDMQSFRRRSVQELPPHSCLQDGRYTLLEKIATGGQAKIYKAFDRQRDCNVALKELILPINAGAEVRNRSFANVKKEATLVGSLNHPGILKLLDNFVEDHRAYIVLEFIEGKTLRQMVQSGTAFDPAATVSTAIMIAEILAHLHGQSPPVVHRDIAPDNLMQAVDGRVVLLDFNVAQQLESNTTKTVVGKHNYMAPEQFKGKPTTQSDLYSLGCTLYFLLTAVDPRPLSCSHPGALVEVPSWLDEVVGKLTALDSSQRFATAEELLCELRAG